MKFGINFMLEINKFIVTKIIINILGPLYVLWICNKYRISHNDLSINA
jgi:hypothetical protein